MSPRPELPLARDARARYDLAADEPWGLGAWTDLQTARALAQALNLHRDLDAEPTSSVRAGHIHALGLVHAYWSQLLDDYLRRHGGDVFEDALRWLEQQFGAPTIREMLEAFRDLFDLDDAVPELPDSNVETATGETTNTDTPADDTPKQPHSPEASALESMVLLWLVQENPATAPLRDLFADDALEARTGYRQVISSLETFFATKGTDGDRPLFDALLAPVNAAPSSLGDQLSAVLSAQHHHGPESGPDANRAQDDGPNRRRLQLGLDILREEERPVFVGPGGDPTPPPPPKAHDFSDLAGQAARFSDDHAWMGELVLVAKNALVWLDQLSRAYDRPIQRLDDIPDDALERLSRQGFTGLWLIGIWRRSEASARIKHRCGQPDAGASAYAIHDYVVAESLGGDEAADDLAARARRFGLRLACDMVPNHLGLDARWVIEAPEHFVQVARCPYPNYTFEGPDLSSDPTIALHLEDHYYDRSDAAVVFRRTEQATGDVRYLYHGNDGTATPWNDTAQLDYLRAETREAVIESILTVARRFPVIRFDAAMTLAKQHIQRLWHPVPGTAGDIPSRAEHAVPPEAFEAAMPREFWREVVERVAEEVPETLLLAEAFWLMEGFFVRTLGMHRVYNSAFMHMVRDEDNAKFRQTLANTLAFDPGILQRFVNFTTNPDEETAADQFGRGDKYFAACTLMITLPGLPLFGHGQVEGLHEKYGMEYVRARVDEQPDPGFVAHHQRTLVPLLRQRALFAGVEHFHLFDFESDDGQVLEDVYALANRHDDDRALVLIHNRDAEVAGRVQLSVPKQPTSPSAPEETAGADPEAVPRKGGSNEPETKNAHETPTRSTLADALGLEIEDGLYYRLRDPHRQLDYLRASADFTGDSLDVGLGPYDVRVLLDFEPLRDGVDGPVGRLASQIGQDGVSDLVTTLRDLDMAPLLAPLRAVFTRHAFERLWNATRQGDSAATRHAQTLARMMSAALAVIAPRLDGVQEDVETKTSDASEKTFVAEIHRRLAALPAPDAVTGDVIGAPHPFALIGWALLARAGLLDPGASTVPKASRDLIERGRLHRPLVAVLRDAGMADDAIHPQVAAVRLMVAHQDWYRDLGDRPASDVLTRLLDDPDMRHFLGLNTFDEVIWFNSEAFGALCAWLEAVARTGTEAGHGTANDLINALTAVADLRAAEASSEYRLDRLLAAVAPP